MTSFQGSRLEGVHCTVEPQLYGPMGPALVRISETSVYVKQYTFSMEDCAAFSKTAINFVEYRGDLISGVQIRGSSLYIIITYTYCMGTSLCIEFASFTTCFSGWE